MKYIMAVLSAVVFSMPALGSETEKVISNKSLAIVIRDKTAAVEIDYLQKGKYIKAADITPIISGKKIKSSRIGGIEDAKNEKKIKVDFITDDGQSYEVTFILKESMPFVETQSGEAIESLSVRMNSQYAIVPDFFANDLVYDPSRTEKKTAIVYLPNEYIVLNLIDQGNAILMCLVPSQAQQMELTVENKRFSQMEIDCRKEKRAWIAVLATPGIWHAENTDNFDSLKDKMLDWKLPFSVKWCCDYPRTNGTTDSFGIVRKEGKRYNGFSSIPNQVTRMAWTTSRSSFIYPCYSEGESVFLRIPLFANYEDITYQEDKSILIYPYERIDETASLPFLPPMDLMRVALANTPEADLYKKIRVELSSKSRYPPTCGITEKAEKRFGDQKEKQEKDQMIKELTAMNKFVEVTRERIDEYQAWAKEIQSFYESQKKAHPELKDLIDDFEKETRQVRQRYESALPAMKIPSNVKKLSDQIVTLIDSEEKNKSEIVKQIGRQIRTIGGTQDGLVGVCRELTAGIRQHAGILMAHSNNKTEREFLQEIRDRAGVVLKVNHGIEIGIEQSRW